MSDEVLPQVANGGTIGIPLAAFCRTVLARWRMSNLYVVRHGQASFFAEDYDQLSLDRRDAVPVAGRVLGAAQYYVRRGLHWAVPPAPGHRPPGRRGLSGRPAWRGPRRSCCPGSTNIEAEAVLKQALPGLSTSTPASAELHAAVRARRGPRRKAAHVSKVVRSGDRPLGPRRAGFAAGRVVGHAFASACIRPSTRSWRPGDGRQVAVFTSGGPVGVCMQRALGTSHRTTLQLAWMVRNAAFSEFLSPASGLRSAGTTPFRIWTMRNI